MVRSLPGTRAKLCSPPFARPYSFKRGNAVLQTKEGVRCAKRRMSHLSESMDRLPGSKEVFATSASRVTLLLAALMMAMAAVISSGLPALAQGGSEIFFFLDDPSTC